MESIENIWMKNFNNGTSVTFLWKDNRPINNNLSEILFKSYRKIFGLKKLCFNKKITHAHS